MLLTLLYLISSISALPLSAKDTIVPTSNTSEIYQIGHDPIYLLSNGDLIRKDNETRVLNIGCKYYKDSEYAVKRIEKVDMSEVFQCRHRPLNSKYVVYLVEDQNLLEEVEYWPPQSDIDTLHFYKYLNQNFNFTTNTSTNADAEIFTEVPPGKTAHAEFHGYHYQVYFKKRTIYKNKCDSKLLPTLKTFWKDVKAKFPTMGEYKIIWGSNCPLGYRKEDFI